MVFEGFARGGMAGSTLSSRSCDTGSQVTCKLSTIGRGPPVSDQINADADAGKGHEVKRGDIYVEQTVGRQIGKPGTAIPEVSRISTVTSEKLEKVPSRAI